MYVSIPPGTVYWATRGSLEMELPLQVLCAESLVPLKTWPRLKQLRIQGNPLTFTCKGKPRESVLLFHRGSSMLDKLPHRDPSSPLLLNDILCDLQPPPVACTQVDHWVHLTPAAMLNMPTKSTTLALHMCSLMNQAHPSTGHL